MKEIRETMPMQTPFGQVQTSEEIAPGIYRFSTAAHGGLYLIPSVNSEMPEAAKCLTNNGNGFQGYYEEDEDFELVVVNFPQYKF